MNKLFCSSAVALAFIAASCTNEMPVGETEGVSTIKVKLPGTIGTRSFGDGMSTEIVKYAVYDGETGEFIFSSQTGFNEENHHQATAEISLANGRSYKIAFFATQAENGYKFDTQNKIIKVDYTKLTKSESLWNEDRSEYLGEAAVPNYNENDYDAFFGMYETDGIVTEPITGEVTLRRFLAQVNWATSEDLDYDEGLTHIYGEKSCNLKTKVEYTNVYTDYDFWNGTVTGEPTTAVFDYCSRPALNSSYPGNWRDYDYVSVNYLLVPADKSLVKATLTPNDGVKDYKAVSVDNLPVRANYQTFIEGVFFSSEAIITATTSSQFDGSYYNGDEEEEEEGVE